MKRSMLAAIPSIPLIGLEHPPQIATFTGPSHTPSLAVFRPHWTHDPAPQRGSGAPDDTAGGAEGAREGGSGGGAGGAAFTLRARGGFLGASVLGVSLCVGASEEGRDDIGKAV